MTTPESASAIGGIVLAGGRSVRLGMDKATLDWHGSPLVERVARLLARGIGGGPIVIVRAHGDTSPVPPVFESASDPLPDAGPLVGLLEGLRRLEGRVESAIAVPCDLPLLHPVTIRALAHRLTATAAEMAAPTDADGRILPLPGAWRITAIQALATAVEAGERSPARSAASLEVAAIPLHELAADAQVAAADPDLTSLRDIDCPADLGDLLSSPPRVRVARDGRVTAPHAWTLGDVAAATGGDPEGPCAVNGLPVEFDPRFPLAERDAISLPPALDL